MGREEINIKNRVYNHNNNLIKVKKKTKVKNITINEKNYKHLVICFVRYYLYVLKNNKNNDFVLS